ncbi:MAG: DUF1287 domain-containing protein [Bacteroidales bacterium]
MLLRPVIVFCLFHAVLFLHGTKLCAQSLFFKQLADSAITLTTQKVQYDPGYYRIPYPGGDLPANRGVCTDVIIRAYRKVGVDLQQLIHEDMQKHFTEYPPLWGMNRPDPNIDHRRVPNLAAFFRRHGVILALSRKAGDYVPGDIVTWDLGNGIPHIGIVVNRKNPEASRNLVVHNIGRGQVMEDCLFVYKITGHFRYKP